MKMRVLADTCVILDYLQHREPFFEDAQKLILEAANKSIYGFLTAKSLADIHYLLRRSIHNEAAVRDFLSNLLRLFNLLDTTASDCRQAISSPTSDFEDAIMIETALRSGMSCIVTRNKKDYRNSPLPVYTPSELLELIPPRES